jgi:hypothetical protein
VPIAKGATVVDVCGEKVGTALEYDALNQYLRVEHGWLVPVLIHVPLHAITRSDAKHIQLAVSKDAALNGRWPALPVTAPPDNGVPVGIAYAGVNLTVGNASQDSSISSSPAAAH